MMVLIRNPILAGYWADPYILRDGDDYYLYPTQDSPDWANSKFFAFHSRNLTDWSGPTEVLDVADLAWAKSHAWAPSAVKYQGVYYFCFVANQQIGIARSASPLGPFIDMIGRPLVKAWDYECQSIDPDLFIEGEQIYLLWGQGKGWMVPLSVEENDVKFLTTPVCISEQLYIQRGQDPSIFDIGLYNEGPHLQKLDGRYLLTWSCFDTRDPRYCVRYAWANRITGPYLQPDDNLLIQGKGPILGTGHASITVYQGEPYLFYHRMGERKSGYERETCFDKIRLIDREHIVVEPT